MVVPGDILEHECVCGAVDMPGIYLRRIKDIEMPEDVSTRPNCVDMRVKVGIGIRHSRVPQSMVSGIRYCRTLHTLDCEWKTVSNLLLSQMFRMLLVGAGH